MTIYKTKDRYHNYYAVVDKISTVKINFLMKWTNVLINTATFKFKAGNL